MFQRVILSGVEVSLRERKRADAKPTSRRRSWDLVRRIVSFYIKVTLTTKDSKDLKEIPLRLRLALLLARPWLDPQKFDYGLRPSLRMTHKFAQILNSAKA